MNDTSLILLTVLLGMCVITGLSLIIYFKVYGTLKTFNKFKRMDKQMKKRWKGQEIDSDDFKL